MARNKVNKKPKISFQERVLNWLKSIFKVQTLSLTIGVISCIIGGLTFYYSFFYHKSEGVVLSRMDSLSINIEKNIEYIESNFNPTILPVDLDPEYDKGVIMVKEFQHKALALANYWREKKDTIDISKTINSDYDDIFPKYKWEEDVLNEYRSAAFNVIMLMDEIDKYGEEHGISSYFINKTKWERLKEVEQRKEAYLRVLWKEGAECFYVINTKNSEKKYDAEYRKYLYMALENLNDMKRNELFYSFDDCLFDLVVSQNRLYETSIRDYLLDKRE